MSQDITVVIPTIAPRSDSNRTDMLLDKALSSVFAQTLRPAALVIVEDLDRQGAALTRQRGLDMVQTEWCAFLDDDDEMYPNHLADLMATAEATDADYVFSHFDCTGADPFPTNEGIPWDNDVPRQTTITVLVRTWIAQRVGFFGGAGPDVAPDGHRAGEDYLFTLGCMREGAKIVTHPARTWLYRHHGQNTSGSPDQW